jgi:DNA-binding MarR family transcriptional regulator
MSIVSNSEKIVCLCAHQRYAENLGILEQSLTQQGYITTTIVNASNTSSVGNLTDDTLWAGALGLNQRKIDMCSVLVVANGNGYIDELTRSQVAYAQRQGKPVQFVQGSEQIALPKLREPAPAICENMTVSEGAVIDVTQPFIVEQGAVLLYGPDPDRPAFSLVANHVWPGIDFVQEVWHVEAASNTRIKSFSSDEQSLKLFGEIIRWSMARAGQVRERVLKALTVVDSAGSQEELSAIVGCRRESVTMALADLKKQGLVEKSLGRIRLTDAGVVYAANLSTLEMEEDAAMPLFEEKTAYKMRGVA